MNRFKNISTSTDGRTQETRIVIKMWNGTQASVRLTKRDVKDIVTHLQSTGRIKLAVK